MFDHYEDTARPLKILLAKSPAAKQNIRQKVVLMQKVYFDRKGNIDVERKKHLEKLLDESLDKLYKANFMLEHIWALSHADRGQWLEILKNGGTQIECTPETEQMVQLYFECFLLEVRTFLAFYMNYLCDLLSDGKISSPYGLDLSGFAKGIKNLKKTGSQTAERVEEYFLREVMDIYPTGKKAATSHWGDLSKSLRDKITHYQLLRFGRDGKEMIQDKVLFNWPTIRGQTIDRFSQEIDNGMFFLVHDVSMIIYNLPWQTGPYRADLWNDSD